MVHPGCRVPCPGYKSVENPRVTLRQVPGLQACINGSPCLVKLFGWCLFETRGVEVEHKWLPPPHADCSWVIYLSFRLLSYLDLKQGTIVVCICLQFKRFTKQNHNLQVNQIRDPYYDWKYGFVTLEEYIAIAKNHSVGIYPEFKELTATNQVLN
jgi:hypothetical protein